MAFSKELWEKAKGYYEAGLSLRDIEKKTGISNSQINIQAKSKQWVHKKNADIIKAEVDIQERKQALKQAGDNIALNCINEITNELIIANQLISSSLMDNIREANKKMMKGGILKKRIDKEGNEYKEIEEYDQSQYKMHGEMLDKAKITFGLADRHAKPTVMQQGQQSNITIEPITPQDITTMITNLKIEDESNVVN